MKQSENDHAEEISSLKKEIGSLKEELNEMKNAPKKNQSLKIPPGLSVCILQYYILKFH